MQISEATFHNDEVLILVYQVAEGSSRRAQSWGALSKAGAAVHSSSASVSNLTELMHKGRNMVKVCNPSPILCSCSLCNHSQLLNQGPSGQRGFYFTDEAYYLNTANYPWAYQ